MKPKIKKKYIYIYIYYINDGTCLSFLLYKGSLFVVPIGETDVCLCEERSEPDLDLTVNVSKPDDDPVNLTDCLLVE